MTKHDIILHFEWVHSSHIHKYLAFNKLLNKECNCLMILDNGKFGVTPKQRCKFKDEYFENVVICSMKDAFDILSRDQYKIYVGSGGGSKANRYWLGVANKKSVTVQLSDMFGDSFCHD